MLVSGFHTNTVPSGMYAGSAKCVTVTGVPPDGSSTMGAQMESASNSAFQLAKF